MTETAPPRESLIDPEGPRWACELVMPRLSDPATREATIARLIAIGGTLEQIHEMERFADSLTDLRRAGIEP